MSGIVMVALAVELVLLQSLLGWRWTLALLVPLVVLVLRRPIMSALLVMATIA